MYESGIVGENQRARADKDSIQNERRIEGQRNWGLMRGIKEDGGNDGAADRTTL